MRAKEVAQTRALLVSGHMHHGNGIGDNRGFVQPRDVGVGPGVVSATGQRYLCIVKLEKTAKSDLAMEAAATPEPALATPSPLRPSTRLSRPLARSKGPSRAPTRGVAREVRRGRGGQAGVRMATRQGSVRDQCGGWVGWLWSAGAG